MALVTGSDTILAWKPTDNAVRSPFPQEQNFHEGKSI